MDLGQIVRGKWFLVSNVHCNGDLTQPTRDMIQKAFFPATYTNRTATQDLKPGDTRVHIFLKFLLELRGDVTIRLPVREASKVREQK